MPRTITALFNHVDQATAAVEALRLSGYSDDQASAITPNPSPTFTAVSRELDDRLSALELAGAGAATGGLMAGLLTLVMSGPALIAAGLGVAAGGALGGLFAVRARVDDVVWPAPSRRGAVVTLNATPDKVPAIRAILERYEPVTLRDQPSVWRRQGWSPHESHAPALFILEEDSVVTRRVQVTRDTPPTPTSPPVEVPAEQCDNQRYYERYFHP